MMEAISWHFSPTFHDDCVQKEKVEVIMTRLVLLHVAHCIWLLYFNLPFETAVSFVSGC